MNNFIVSARKYRPSTFSDVVGQSSITNTLSMAIKNNHLAHSFCSVVQEVLEKQPVHEF